MVHIVTDKCSMEKSVNFGGVIGYLMKSQKENKFLTQRV